MTHNLNRRIGFAFENKQSTKKNRYEKTEAKLKACITVNASLPNNENSTFIISSRKKKISTKNKNRLFDGKNQKG